MPSTKYTVLDYSPWAEGLKAYKPSSLTLDRVFDEIEFPDYVDRWNAAYFEALDRTACHGPLGPCAEVVNERGELLMIAAEGQRWSI